jgi:trigger factor
MSDKKADSHHDSESFENEHVSVSVKREPECKVSMEITVTPEASEAAYKKAIKMINKEVSIPGFRKGKAPTKMVEDNYGKYIQQEWQEILVKTAFQDAVQLTKIYPLTEETIQKPQLKQASREQGGIISIQFESSPEIPSIDPKTLKLKKVEKQPVTEEQIEDSLKNIQLHHASWENVEGRGVERGDYIDVDIEDIENPGTYICQDTRFEAAEGKMGGWMLDLVKNKSAGETVEGMSERSEELDKDLEFKPTKCKITIKAIKTASLPELNEELAQKVGAESVEDLKTKVSANLNTQAEEDVRLKLRQQLEDTLAKEYPFEVPHTLVKREIQNRINHLKHQMKNAGQSEEAIHSKIEELREKISDEVKQAFRLFFISRHVADENKIGVTQDELVRELMMQMYSRTSPIDTSLDPEEVRSKVYVNLLSQKVKDFLIDQAEVQ